MSQSKRSLQEQSAPQEILTPTVAQARGGESNPPPMERIRTRHVLILGGLTAFGPLSTDMYLPALPMVSHDLGADMTQTQITLTAAILGLALGQVISGPISDARGRRQPLLIGILFYVLTSLLCIVAPSVGVLSVLRFLQGIAGAAGIVLALAIARDLYVGNALARCISLLMMVNFLAPMLAPLLGGQLLAFTSWRGVFVTLALIGVVAILAVAFGLRETLPGERRQRGGILSLLRTFRALLLTRRFMGYALTCSFAFTAGIVYISSSSFLFQNVYGLSPQIVGYLYGINSLGLVLASQMSARIVARVSPQRLLTWGIGGIALAGMLLLVVVLSSLGLIAVLLPLFILVASLGLIVPNATSLALVNVDPRNAGSASALLGVLQIAPGALLAPLVGLGGTTNAAPMAIAIAVGGLATLITYRVLCRPFPTR